MQLQALLLETRLAALPPASRQLELSRALHQDAGLFLVEASARLLPLTSASRPLQQSRTLVRATLGLLPTLDRLERQQMLPLPDTEAAPGASDSGEAEMPPLAVSPTLCPACGAAEETEAHLFLHCPAFAELRSQLEAAVKRRALRVLRALDLLAGSGASGGDAETVVEAAPRLCWWEGLGGGAAPSPLSAWLASGGECRRVLLLCGLLPRQALVCVREWCASPPLAMAAEPEHCLAVARAVVTELQEHVVKIWEKRKLFTTSRSNFNF